MKKTISALAVMLMFSASVLSGREITDMSGRKVSVPDTVKSVYCTSNPMMCSIYVMDHNILAGVTFKLRERERKYFNKRTQELPVLGSISAQGPGANSEVILAAHPDIIFNSSWGGSFAFTGKESKTLESMNIPLVNLIMEGIKGYPKEFLFLGQVLNLEKRGKLLSDYAAKVVKEMEALSASVPADKRLKVYYAEGADGLQTEYQDSVHAELIPITGAENVNKCVSKAHKGMDRISIEQVLLLDPDAILVQEHSFYKKIFTDPKWKDMRAVKNKRVYYIPKEPLNWFDRPPSCMRLMGAQWTASCLYPEYYTKDIRIETKKFFALFFDLNLTDQQVNSILSGE